MTKTNNHRMELARKLLKLDESVDMKSHINALTKQRKEQLRDIVDWVEEYEAYESKVRKSVVMK